MGLGGKQFTNNITVQMSHNTQSDCEPPWVEKRTRNVIANVQYDKRNNGVQGVTENSLLIGIARAQGSVKSGPILTGSRLLYFSKNMCHAGFEANKGSQMWWQSRVIFGEGLDFATVSLAPLTRQEAQRAVPGCLKFSVRLHRTSSMLVQPRNFLSLTILQDIGEPEAPI